MPYIITTIDGYGIKRYGIDVARHVASARRAVATLDEARERVAIQASDRDGWNREGLELPAIGGTVGPLPDGTVIEVEQVDWIDFERLAREAAGTTGDLPPIETFDNDRYRAEIIDAYNAAQEH